MMSEKKAKMLLLYLIFGAGTTLVNLLLFEFLYYQLELGTIVSNLISWIGAVLFAFITNKWYVFESKSWNFRLTLKELIGFSGARVMTGLIDLCFMYVTVDFWDLEARIMKLLVNIIVIILNYVASKIIFK